MLPLSSATAVAVLLSVLVTPILGQGDTLNLSSGYMTVQTANFNATFARSAQLLVSLKPKAQTFDFLPYDLLSSRAGNSQYHWGDITLRFRKAGNATWTSVDSSAARKAVTNVSTASDSSALVAGNLRATLPGTAGVLNVTRTWSTVQGSGDLGLNFAITNIASTAVEIGSLGFPAEFNSIFTGRTAEQIQAKCSLSDPYIGMHGGYIRVSPVSGNGPALVVTPLGDTPMEAYRNLVEPYYDATGYGSQTFEGLYEWQVLSEAWAENEWTGAQPWNAPSSRILQPGETLTAGLRFSVSTAGIQGIEDVVKKTGTPVVRGIPGFIIPSDTPAQLIVSPPSGISIQSFTSDPAGALTVTQTSPNLYQVSASSPSTFGRVRLTITYTNTHTQTIHYFITAPGPTTLTRLGSFLTTSQWYVNTSDPFPRSPSILSYDHSTMAPVTQDDRVWIAGLSDEAGAGSFLAAAMKQAAQPSAAELAKLELFVNATLWGGVQNRGDFTVRKSTFFYQPSLVPGFAYSSAYDWTGWESWNRAAAYATDRAYDYVHVAATYWALYRAARAYPALVTVHAWDWYLNQSCSTVLAAMATDAGGNWLVGYATDGLMGETVFGALLTDLRREGWTALAGRVEAKMRARATLWNGEAVPFGSEMAWDSTGQEGVYYWSKYFGYNSTAQKALGTVLGFMPTVAHWGWNGNARRYWDNLYGGKLRRIERQIHHYGSGLNALVALSAFRSSPSSTTNTAAAQYLLRIGHAGTSGPLTNIHADGFASASFHSWPSTLQWDAYSGDYGPNFAGLVLGTATYLVQDAEVAGGWAAYGGVVTVDNGGNAVTVTVQPRDAIRRRVFVAPVGTMVELDAGVIQEVVFNVADGSLTVVLGQLDGVPSAASAVLWVQNEGGGKNYTVSSPSLTTKRLGWEVPLGSAPVTVVLTQAK